MTKHPVHLPLRYVPYHRLGGMPNVVVDGSASEGTVLTLSHWPNTPCPKGLEADLSAEMAFGYQGRADLHDEAEVVSNNHFDQDGLVSVYALSCPEDAIARRQALVDLAAAGDFAIYQDRRAARASMTIAAYADPYRSPLGPAPGDYQEWTGQLYVELLDRLPEIIDHPGRFRKLWEEEDATLAASEDVIASGTVDLSEIPELDLAVVTVPSHAPDRGGHRFGGMWATGLHPMAICNATHRFVILTMRGRSYELSFRYETWVQYRSRHPRARVDLSALVDELNDLEPEGRWVFDGVQALTPRLCLEGASESTISPPDVIVMVSRHLATASPAWDPYSPVPHRTPIVESPDPADPPRVG